MSDLPAPPQAYQDFTERFPGLADAWDLIGEAGTQGPLEDPALRLLKLAIAVGAMSRGAIRASVRKARALGISRRAIEQVVALGAGTIGLPASIEAYRLVQEGFAEYDAFLAGEEEAEGAKDKGEGGKGKDEK